MDRFKKKFSIMMKFTLELSNLSTCKRRGQGAIIIQSDFSAVPAIGYNGPAAGLSNDFCTNQISKCGCAHAEANAIGKLGHYPYRSLVMLCTEDPCSACANAIINCGKIGLFISFMPYSDSSGVFRITEAGILFERLNTNNPDTLHVLKNGVLSSIQRRMTALTNGVRNQ